MKVFFGGPGSDNQRGVSGGCEDDTRSQRVRAAQHVATGRSLGVAERELLESRKLCADANLPWRRSPLEKLRDALPVLLAARKAVVFDGAEPIDAIQQAGMAGIECWWAREALLSVIPSATLQLWQADPAVKQSDRTRAFDRAIRLCRRALGHKGGWTVGDERLWRELPRLMGVTS